MSNESKPADLGSAGSALWDDIAPGYVLRPDEVAVLTSACKTADMIAELEKAWNDLGRPYESLGSTKQPQAHYLIVEIRTQRGAQASLLRQLNLPDDAAAAPGSSEAARGAATSRWSRGS